MTWRVWITRVDDYILFNNDKGVHHSVCSVTGSKTSCVTKRFTSSWNADCRCTGTFYGLCLVGTASGFNFSSYGGPGNLPSPVNTSANWVVTISFVSGPVMLEFLVSIFVSISLGVTGFAMDSLPAEDRFILDAFSTMKHYFMIPIMKVCSLERTLGVSSLSIASMFMWYHLPFQLRKHLKVPSGCM